MVLWTPLFHCSCTIYTPLVLEQGSNTPVPQTGEQSVPALQEVQ